MPWQVVIGFILTEIVPGLGQLFTNVIVPIGGKLLKFTLFRIPRIPVYLRLLWAIYSDSEPQSEARKYLTSILLILGSILSFMAYCYVPLTGFFIIGSVMTPVAAMVALVISLVALDSIFALNHDYLLQQYPGEFASISKDIADLKNLLGGKKWEEIVRQTQGLLDDVKSKIDPDGVYDDTLLALLKSLDEYLWNPESDSSLSPGEINKRIVEEGLPPFAKVSGSAAEGALAGLLAGAGGHGAAAGMFMQAGLLVNIKAALGIAAGGIVLNPAAYAAAVVVAPLGLAVAAGAGVFWGANTLRDEGEKRKLSKFLAEVLIAALPMAWVDGTLSPQEQDTIEQFIQNAPMNEQDIQRVRDSIHSHQNFDQVLHEGLLKEKDPRKQQMKCRLILSTAYELARADGFISPEELALHDRMARIMETQEPEIKELRRLLLLKAGISIHNRITVERGDLTQESVDAIVNSTNSNLQPGQKLGLVNLPGKQMQLDKQIHQAAGADLKKECKKADACEVGEAKLTKGYNLPAQWVIHTVAPKWQENDLQSSMLLKQCYQNSLSLAIQNSVETLAFPALGTGAGQFPIEQAAAIAVATVKDFLEAHLTIQKVKFICNDEETYAQFVAVLKDKIGELPEEKEFDATDPKQQSHHHYETYHQAA